MTLGFYQNFPQNIHRIESFNSILSSKKLQSKLIHILHDLNRIEFSFEEVTNPTVPHGSVNFEFGLAESNGFNYIDDEELKKALSFLSREHLHSTDFYCSIRYYKTSGKKKTPLKFDYYMLRAIYSKDSLEVQVFHERGPRYISPEELTAFIVTKINETSIKNRKILKKTVI